MMGSKGVRKSPIDWMLVLIVVVLVILGLIMQYSASSYKLSYVERQAAFAAVGFAAMFIICFLPVKFIHRISIPLYILALVITASTAVIGSSAKGAARWIEIAGIRFQPSELLKAAMIMALAVIICRYINEINNYPKRRLKEIPAAIREAGFKSYISDLMGYILMLALVAVAALDVIMASKDLGTGIIVFGIGFVIMWVVSPHRGYLIAIAAAAVAAGVGFIIAFSYRTNRIKAWLDLENNTTELGFQIKQGLYAIGSGGWFGKGLGRSIQKDVIPEPHTDMIFTIVCEELGIIGGIIIIILFILMILRLRTIYTQITDLYGKIIVMGVAAHIALQALINLGVMTNLIPNTGVPLPFISYGGTSLMCLLGEIGLVLRARRTQFAT